LIVDDNPVTLEAMSLALDDDLAVRCVESGESCLACMQEFAPDLVLLDIEMPGIDGYETCRRLRACLDVPVIFVSAHDTLDDRLQAYDSGGDDFIVKSYDAGELNRKVRHWVDRQLRHRQLAEQQASTQEMAMNFLKSMGETGVLLDFVRKSMGCLDYVTLATNLVNAINDYGITAHVQIRHAADAVTLTPHGEARPLEAAIIEQSAELGRIFQFYTRMVVNYEQVTILVMNMPKDEALAGRLRDAIVFLAENAEAIAEAVSVRQESAMRAETMQVAAMESAEAVETLRQMYHDQRSETMRLLHELTDSVEDAYLFLGLSQTQEETVSRTIRQGADEILQLFVVGDEMDQKFAAILDSLGHRKNDSPEVW